MTRDELIERLIALPAEIARAEEALLLMEERRRVAQETLQKSEDALLLNGIEGKNAEQRAAAVRAETQTEREMVTACDYRVTEAKIALRRVTNELAALKAVARLLAGGER